jgi:hypothetical protein
MAASMRSRRVAEIPVQSKTVSGIESVHLADHWTAATPIVSAKWPCAPIADTAIVEHFHVKMFWY